MISTYCNSKYKPHIIRYLYTGVVVSSKNDLVNMKIIDASAGESLAKKFKMDFCEVSAVRILMWLKENIVL